MTIKVLFEDNHLLVVEKPVNIPVQGDISKDMDLLSYFKLYIKDKYNKPGDVYLGLVHRLDRPVGGVMVFARTSKAASRLSEQIRGREMQKTYLAVTEGKFNIKQGTYIDYLWKDRKSNQVKVVSQGFNDGRKAILHYEVLDERNNMALVGINLETGRSHQIRVQLSYNGHPVIGDKKYGGMGRGFTDNLALWSYKLTFRHPVKDEIISITSIPPANKPWDIFSIN